MILSHHGREAGYAARGGGETGKLESLRAHPAEATQQPVRIYRLLEPELQMLHETKEVWKFM